MHLDFSPQQQDLREELREFLGANLPPSWVGVWQGPQAQAQSDMVVSLMADRGWLTYCWPEEYGGSGGSIWDQQVIQEELFAHHEPRGSQYMGVNWLGPVIMQFGTEEQRARLLPEISRGSAYWCQLFSEPEAGSDLASLRTTAIRAADGGFVINGDKVWTSYANSAEHGFLLARSDPQAEKHRGLSVLLIEMDAPGIEIREIPSTIGWHRLHSVRFTDVHVPASCLLGTLHRGWDVAMAALPYERVGNARYARTTRMLAIADALAGDPCDPGDPGDAADDRMVETLALGRMAELLNYRAAAVRESTGLVGWEASAAFAANALYEQESAALIERDVGFMAYVANGDPHALVNGELESFAVRQAPTVTIQAGSYQVQLSIVGQRGLGLPRAT
jgi:alkylation response protein AidB-like acyl-CoA dehydrogenase